ncbi:MAG: hypothetical protein Q9162_003250 [Coniocarpon cinnabarinum]
MAGLSQDLIAQFSEFTGLGPGGQEKAILFLRGNNNNLEQALGAYFDDPNPLRYECIVVATSTVDSDIEAENGDSRWGEIANFIVAKKQFRYDESQFSSNREGGADGSQNQPFQLDDDFGNANQLTSLTAPSRPPSPQLIGPAPPPGFPNTGTAWENPSKEDTEYNEAIKRSLADQQTGVINASGHEVVPDVEANDRRRVPGEPAFLKHMLKPDFLPALINILHSIPSIHDNMLRANTLLTDYGYNPHWWSGEDMQASSVVYYDDAAMTSDANESSCSPVLTEVQRLLAFLDRTERSYGSAEALSRVHAISALEPTGPSRRTLLYRFLEAWDAVDSAHQLFRSTVVDKDGVRNEIHGYEIPSGIPNAGKEPTLIELLDNVIWDKQASSDFEPDNFLDHIAPIQILTMPSHSTWKLRVPSSFFIDRYLLANKHIIIQMKDENAKYVQRIEAIDKALRKLKTYTYTPGTNTNLVAQKQGDAVQLLSDSVEYLEKRAQQSNEQNSDAGESLFDGKTVYKLRAIKTKITERIEALNAERQQALEAMQQYNDVLAMSNPNNQLYYDPQHRYILCGVSVISMRLLVTYAQHASNTSSESKWWKLVYDTTKTTPSISKTIVSESDVLLAASQGINDTMLVYVAESALAGPPPISLPPQLSRFVEKDNEAFREELVSGISSGGGPGPAVPVTITGVRTGSESGASDDSMKVQGDDEGIEMDDQDRPPPYTTSEWDLGDVGGGAQPEMKEKGKPGLFGRMRRTSKSSDEGM